MVNRVKPRLMVHGSCLSSWFGSWFGSGFGSWFGSWFMVHSNILIWKGLLLWKGDVSGLLTFLDTPSSSSHWHLVIWKQGRTKELIIIQFTIKINSSQQSNAMAMFEYLDQKYLIGIASDQFICLHFFSGYPYYVFLD